MAVLPHAATDRPETRIARCPGTLLRYSRCRPQGGRCTCVAHPLEYEWIWLYMIVLTYTDWYAMKGREWVKGAALTWWCLFCFTLTHQRTERNPGHVTKRLAFFQATASTVRKSKVKCLKCKLSGMDTSKATANIAPICHQTGPVCKLGTTIWTCKRETFRDYCRSQRVSHTYLIRLIQFGTWSLSLSLRWFCRPQLCDVFTCFAEVCHVFHQSAPFMTHQSSDATSWLKDSKFQGFKRWCNFTSMNACSWKTAERQTNSRWIVVKFDSLRLKRYLSRHLSKRVAQVCPAM